MRAAIILSLFLTVVQSQTLEELQESFLKLKYGAFLHFNMGTFTGEEWASPGQNPNRFNPTGLNCGQWADAAVAAGMKYMTLTTKHHDGFCLWNSAHTTYDVGSSTWKDGKGDVVREFVDSARSRNIKVCFYYSIWDKTNGSDTTFIKNQLTELLTNYGPITTLWFDGWGWNVGYSKVPYTTIRNHIKSLQPNCLLLENNHEHNLNHSEIMLYERNIDGIPPSTNTVPLEVCCNIRSDGNWFYHASGNCTLRSLDYLYTSLTGINAGRGNYLLDLTPDTAGLIPQCQVDRLKEFAAYKPDTTLKNQDFAQYSGSWKNAAGRGFGDYMDDLQYTQTPGDSFVVAFKGTGIDFISELNSDHGAFDIFIDGVFQKKVDLTAPAGTRPAMQVVFSVKALTNTTHRLKGVYTGTSARYGVVDAFKIYTDIPVSVKSPQFSASASVQGLQYFRGGRIVLPASGTCQVYSVSGKRKALLHAGEDGSAILPDLPAGVYMIRFKGAEGTVKSIRMFLR